VEYSALVNNKLETAFIKELGKILLYQLIFQSVFTMFIYVFALPVNTIQYVNISAYVLIFFISIHSLKYTVANKPLVILFIVEFFIFALIPTIGLAISPFSFNVEVLVYKVNTILASIVVLYITAYLFF